MATLFSSLLTNGQSELRGDVTNQSVLLSWNTRKDCFGENELMNYWSFSSFTRGMPNQFARAAFVSKAVAEMLLHLSCKLFSVMKVLLL